MEHRDGRHRGRLCDSRLRDRRLGVVEVFRIRSTQDLKRQMINKGMAADDIERILAARVVGDDPD